MHLRTPRHPIRLLPLALAVALPAWADSGVGVDLWNANPLHPEGRLASHCDTRATTLSVPMRVNRSGPTETVAVRIELSGGPSYARWCAAVASVPASANDTPGWSRPMI